jgi:hypothetical protein
MTSHSKFFLHTIVFLFIAGASFVIGRFTTEPSVEVISETGATKTVTVRDNSDALDLAKALSEIDALKAENTRLKESLQEVETAEPEAVEAPVAAPVAEEQPRRRNNWRNRMEELKETDPERYAQEVERRQRMIKTMEDHRNARINFLDSIDTSLLSEDAQVAHARFTNAIARQGQLQQEIMATLDLGEEPSEELQGQMQATFRDIMETQDEVRTALLGAIATSMGLEGEDSEEFSNLIQEVYNATGGRGGPMIRMGGGRRGNRPPER